MFRLKNNVLFLFVLLSCTLQAQCDYNLDNVFHINCNGGSTGEINITITNTSVDLEWLYPDTITTSNSPSISNLYAGDYILTLSDNGIEVCTDTITVLQTIDIAASFELSNICNEDDSADVKTIIWGGTPPYTYQWLDSNGDPMPGETTQNIDSLATSTYTLTITDTNGCPGYIDLIIHPVIAMNPFMSSESVICKDDNSGSARVFVTEGTPPFQFQWSTDSFIIIEHDSFSVIESLIPGEYIVDITDAMGCEISDTIQVVSNPGICLTVYKAFSPNDDAVHEFWEIENINLYPEALVLVYDRNGRQVYRRRNYENTEGQAFGGKDQQGRVLPSGTYYYIIDLENTDDVFKGVLTIVR